MVFQKEAASGCGEMTFQNKEDEVWNNSEVPQQ